MSEIPEEHLENETSASIFKWACDVLKQERKRKITHISKLGEEIAELQREINMFFILKQILNRKVLLEDYLDAPELFTEEGFKAASIKNDEGLNKEFADVFIVLSNLSESCGVSLDLSNTRIGSAMFITKTHEVADTLGTCLEKFSKLSYNCLVGDIEDDKQAQVWIKELIFQLNRVLRDLASQMNVDIQLNVNKKMKINRARKWNLSADGTGSHVK